MQPLRALILPVAASVGGLGAGGVVILPVVVVPVVVGVVAVVAAVVGFGLADAAREEHGGNRQHERQRAHG